jgi:hypothetical protein
MAGDRIRLSADKAAARRRPIKEVTTGPRDDNGMPQPRWPLADGGAGRRSGAMIRGLAASVAAAVLAAGCALLASPPIKVRHDPYPVHWPALAPPATGCPALTGRYSNADRMYGNVPLAQWVLPDTRTPLGGFSSVELDGPRDKIVAVRLYEGSGADLVERGRYEWKEGEDYRCEDGWLVLSNTKVIPLGVIVANTTGRFTLARDGSLVVERREEGGGVVLVVPAYASIRDWLLYRRLDAAPASEGPPG